MGSPSTGRNKQGRVRIITISLQEFGSVEVPENAVEVRRASNSVLWKPGAGHNMKGRTEKATDNAIGQVRVEEDGWRKWRSKAVWLEVGPQTPGREDHQRKPQGFRAEIILVRVLKWNKGENKRRESAWTNGLRILAVSFLSSLSNFTAHSWRGEIKSLNWETFFFCWS